MSCRLYLRLELGMMTLSIFVTALLAIYKHGVEIHREYLDVQMATRPYKIRGAIKNYTGIQYTTGRSQVNAFLDDYDAPSNITYHIVFVAGMYYAIFLQDYHNMLFGFIRGEKDSYI